MIILLFQSCGKPKSILICGDHACVNKAEAEQFFAENLTIEVKIIDHKKIKEVDLIKLNLKNNSEQNREILIERTNIANKEIKILSNDEIQKIKKNINEKKKNKKIVKKITNESSNKNTQLVEKSEKILKEDAKEIFKVDINREKKDLVDICTIVKKCNIDEISKYLIKQGKNKNFPDITSKQ